MRSFFRVIGFALQDMFRNFSLSFMTVLILVLMLLSVNTVVFIRQVTEQATRAVKNQIDVSIYFNHSASEEQVTEARSYISSFPEVVDSEFFTREQTLELFKKTYAANENILAALGELPENPLGPMLIVKTREPGDYRKLIQALSVPEYAGIVEARTFEDTETAINRIDTITAHVEQFSVALTVFFALIAFLIIFNTIRVAIYTQRIEISIKKLVGASNWFIRGPYLIEALVFSTLATGITLCVIWAAAGYIDPYLASIFGTGASLTSELSSHILLLAGIQFCGVLVLTIFSSMLAMRKHLKV